MSITTGHQALIKRIVQMSTTANIVLPNGPGKDLPRYVIQAAGGSQRTATVGGITESYPEIVVQVETGTDYADDNDDLVADLVSLFAVNSRFDGVTIIDAPLPRPPLPVDRGVYSVPVIIRGFYPF